MTNFSTNFNKFKNGTNVNVQTTMAQDATSEQGFCRLSLRRK